MSAIRVATTPARGRHRQVAASPWELFGSRRHYDFSHEGYRRECARIVTLLADRFGQHPGVAAWQVDNEYDCHRTTLSYSDAARRAFREWLQAEMAETQRKFASIKSASAKK